VVREKYRILGEIGTGGMATVYKAEHIHFGEIRALKVMSSELAADESLVRRFMQEAKLSRRLQHPNAVRVDDIDRAEDGLPFIVMEYIEGYSLKDLIEQQGALPVERVLPIVKQIAAALDAAHGLGMVHRDIKPSNIILLEGLSGEVAKVLDFGIAKVKEARLGEGGVRELTLTSTGMLIGTPSYMSPEQANGKRGDELDGRSDLYSLGVVTYQMLTGELPINGSSEIQMLMAHIGTEPVPIEHFRPDLPAPIAALVMSCLAKDCRNRPQSGKAIIEEIENCENWQVGGPSVEPEIHTDATKIHVPDVEVEEPRTKKVAVGWWISAVAFIAVAVIAVAVIISLRHPGKTVQRPPEVVHAHENPVQPQPAPQPVSSTQDAQTSTKVPPKPNKRKVEQTGDDDGMTISAPKK
jgi:serine/threonine-protein kinase